ncbi:uncharacterized protein K489DRAFT_200064 [Dissoconium aciculare CBS 342.82]|uniref:AAA+ ATPase domain-containing protein n=1 Tax=Dissoconium aciculare CBS 342.82 TaxID=1314786 RepID=A0A6J3M7N8_9PEZI|nr:uncharacterized protein K489DRAFT_200064 [Dissoconium aciculare CBS 342.82]KAF1823569.1 hypothetical protein K489DRAFT_200064 [Dissoconium aciculare CBS 342.82]
MSTLLTNVAMESTSGALMDKEDSNSSIDASNPTTTIPEQSKQSLKNPGGSKECLGKSHKKSKPKHKSLSARKDKKKGKKVKSRVLSSESDSSDSDSSDSSSDSDSSSSEDDRKKKKASRKAKNSRKLKDSSQSEESEAVEATETTDGMDAIETQLTDIAMKVSEMMKKSLRRSSTSSSSSATKGSRRKGSSEHSKKSSHKADGLKYKRVDQIWDSTIHNFALKESAEDDDGEFAEFAFLVRRVFDYKNQYTETVIDIKAKQLRLALQEVLKECKSISLETEEPSVDPNVLFLYLEDLRKYYKKTLKAKIKREKKKKIIKRLEQQRALVKSLVGFIDEDYEKVKKTLFPLLAAGNITYDLLWALFRPNDIAITSTYGHWDEPRCFKIDFATKLSSMMKGNWYCIEGKYLEYDGKNFGYGDFQIDVESFKGPRKITSLATYPLKYHKDPEGVQKKIIERGEKFVAMSGMHYKFHKGLAFMKKKKQVLKININSRVMVDPATFRRINANYPISFIQPKEEEELYSDSESECGCGEDSDDESAQSDHGLEELDGDEDAAAARKYKYKWTTDKDGEEHYVAVEVDENGEPVLNQDVELLAGQSDGQKPQFSKEQLLLTSSVVLGFAFAEKYWLEFTLSGIHEITYNDKAFESLVLPPDQKKTIHALVNSHKFHGTKTIDDVVQGKGKGLVAVLHGPPGTGKTLTAEGISELLRCPLYMVSAGELGTDPARLEAELQKILDIAHTWGAVLLLDEADVFLERRQVHDIHRNALVSIFLRLLEYFQGILFLTTNRVETFDDAFQSRIHVALKYGQLTAKARKTVWKMFIDIVRTTGDSGDGTQKVAEISDEQYEMLSRKQLNGRQIKNSVRTAQALALNENAIMTLEHIHRVLDVAESFERDLKGGSGYTEAMRSYT